MKKKDNIAPFIKVAGLFIVGLVLGAVAFRYISNQYFKCEYDGVFYSKYSAHPDKDCYCREMKSGFSRVDWVCEKSAEMDAEEIPAVAAEQEISCGEEVYAYEIDQTCPAGNQITKAYAEEYMVDNLRIQSPQYEYANIRTNSNFAGNTYLDNVILRLKHGAQFCGGGPLKPIDPNTGVIGPRAYRVLLQDEDGKYCKGYISENLVLVEIE
jgi:hypothetical protein